MLTDEQLCRICIKPDLPSATLTDLPDTYQWTAVLRAARKPMAIAAKVMDLQFFYGAIFTGPAGNGRHSTAYALANTLCKDKDGYKAMVSIHSDDLDFEDREDVFIVLNRVIRVAREAGSLILLLEHCGENPHSTLLQRHLLRIQRVLTRENIRLYLIVIADSEADLDAALLSSIPRYHCPPPDKKAIKRWAETMMKSPVPIKIKNKTAADVAKACQGLSWKQLNDLHNHLLRLIVLNYVMSKRKFDSKGLTEEQVYREGLVTLPEDAVAGILASTAAQRIQHAAVGTAVPYPVVGSIDLPENGGSSSAPDDTGGADDDAEDPLAVFMKTIGDIEAENS